MNTDALLKRVPPYDEKSEAAALGSAIMDADAAGVIVEMLKEHFFYLPRHRLIFKAIRKLLSENKPLDELLLVTKLEAAGMLEQIGGRDTIGRLLMETPSPANVESYCEAVREQYIRRCAIEAAGRILQADTEHVPLKEMLERSIGTLEKLLLGKLGSAAEPEDAHDIAVELVKDALNEPARDYWGLRTGLAGCALDDWTGGVVAGQLWIIAARPGIGKTTLLTSMAMGIHDLQPDAGQPLIVTTEMSSRQIVMKMIAAKAGVHPTLLRKRKLDSGGRERTQHVVDEVLLGGIKILYEPRPTLEQLHAIARRHKRQFGLPVMIVDLASYIEPPEHFNEENRCLAAVAKGLRDLGGRLGCGVLAAVQLNRAVNANANRRPGDVNLKGTGAWEEVADFVMLLHRPGKDAVDKDRRTHIIMEKNREDGPTGVIYVKYLPAEGCYVSADDKGGYPDA